eukprot:1342042-Prorocentrum_lima.AAC.1
MVEQKWQEWVGQRDPSTPTSQHAPTGFDVARTFESMERHMSMLEPSLKDLAVLAKHANVSRE